MTLSQHPQMIAELNQWEEEKRNREMLTGEQFAHHIIGHVLIFIVGGGEGGGGGILRTTFVFWVRVRSSVLWKAWDVLFLAQYAGVYSGCRDGCKSYLPPPHVRAYDMLWQEMNICTCSFEEWSLCLHKEVNPNPPC